jgi:multiple sugar transport system ATP-binding protein
MASVTFDEVTKRFGDTTAVDQLSLEIADTEFLVFLGPSGCGKTTALRMIAGLETVSAGKLRIGDRLVNDVEARDRDIAMVFQSYALYPHMTVAKNIESPLSVRSFSVDGGEPRKLTKAERAERIAEAARILDLEAYLGRKPAALSGGQRQRVALARAIVSRPKAFLMDEPLSNLDAKLRAQTRAEISDLHRTLGTTIVYVTHDQVEAMTMATRIAVMSAGRLQQLGTPKDVYEAPANLFVAQFIGTPPMNTAAGTVMLDGGAGGIEVGNGRFPLPTGLSTQLQHGQPVVVGARPEHLRLANEGVEGTVRNVEWLGHECLVACDVGPAQVIVRQVGMADVGVDQKVRLSARPGDIHLFDRATTERIR